MHGDHLVEPIIGSAALSGAERDLCARCTAMLAQALYYEEGQADVPSLDRIIIVRRGKWRPPQGYSLKPGNIRFSLGALIEVILSGGAVAAGAASSSVLALILSGLLVLKSLLGAGTLILDEKDAAVAWAVWLLTERAEPATPSAVLGVIDQQIMPIAGRVALSQEAIETSLLKLLDFGCIQKTAAGYLAVEEVIVTIAAESD